MGRSQLLTRRDVASAVRLVHQSLTCGHDPFAWRSCLLDGLPGLLHRDLNSTAAVFICPLRTDGFQISPIRVLGGMDAQQQAFFYKYYGRHRHDVSADPNTPGVLANGHRSFTMSREQFCDDQAWLKSDYYNEFRRPLGCDDLLLSHVLLPGGTLASSIGIVRNIGTKPFGQRDRAIVHLMHSELSRLWQDDAARTPDLPRRQQQVLDDLCLGESEKQIAAKLDLSRATVHNYVSKLHRKLKVSSRGELISKALRARVRRGPRVLPSEALAPSPAGRGSG